MAGKLAIHLAVSKAEQMAADWASMKAGYLDERMAGSTEFQWVGQSDDKKAVLMVGPLENYWADEMVGELVD